MNICAATTAAELAVETNRCISRLSKRPDNFPVVLRMLEQVVKPKERHRPFINWEEAKRLSAGKVEVGAHTMSYPNLTLCDSNQVGQEISGSVETLTARPVKAINLLAYPYGKFDKRIMEIARTTDAVAACTTENEFVHKNTDPFALPRINIYEDVAPTTAMFACRILRLFGRY